MATADVDEAADLADSRDVSTIPHFVLLKHGVQVCSSFDGKQAGGGAGKGEGLGLSWATPNGLVGKHASDLVVGVVWAKSREFWWCGGP